MRRINDRDQGGQMKWWKRGSSHNRLETVSTGEVTKSIDLSH
jgi:hypothetical protein